MKAQHWLLVATALLVWLSCTGPTEPVAGTGGGSEVEITGSVRTPDGAPAAQALLRLRPNDYLPPQPRALGKSVASIADITTDSDGRFMIGGIVAGSYSIEITDRRAYAALMSCDVTPGDNALDLGTHTLLPFATLTGEVAPDSDAGAITVNIYGLERSAPIDPLTGSWSITDLPPGAFTVRVSSSAPDYGATVVDVPPVAPGRAEVLSTVLLPRYSDEDYTQWPFSRTIIINTSPTGAAITEDVHHFPLLVRLDRSTFNFARARSDGRDVRFSRQDGSPLRYEIELWDASAQQAAIWVRLDTIRSNDVTQFFTMHYGAFTDAVGPYPDFSNSAAVFDTANGFAGVWHFGGNDYLADATFNRNLLTDNGSSRGDHLVGAGRYLNGSSYMSASSNVTLEPATLTISCWFRPESRQVAFAKIVSKGQIPPPWNSYSLEMREDWGIAGFQVANVDSSVHTIQSTDPTNSNEWIHLTGVFDGVSGEGRLYYNGISAGMFVDALPLFYPSDRPYPLTIGAQHDGTANFKGHIDEVRVCGTARSAAWIRLCYENQKAGSAVIEITDK